MVTPYLSFISYKWHSCASKRDLILHVIPASSIPSGMSPLFPTSPRLLCRRGLEEGNRENGGIIEEIEVTRGRTGPWKSESERERARWEDGILRAILTE